MMTIVLALVIAPDVPAVPPLADVAALAERIAKTSAQAKDKLAKNDVAAATQNDQRQVKDDLDALIKLLEPPPSSSPSGGGGGESKKPPSDQPPPKPKDSPAPPQPKNGTSNPEPQPAPNAGATPGSVGSVPRVLQPHEESLAKDFWGHLPDAPRQQMMQFYREHFMTKYKDLLGDYYQSLAEKEKK